MKTIPSDNKFISGRSTLLFYAAAGMLISLFISRAALSLLTLCFIIAALLHRDIKKQAGQFLRSPLLWSMSLLFLLPLVSGLWSEDKSNWLGGIYLKLPLLFMPLAFAGDWFFSKRQWEILAFLFIGLVSAACLWSMVDYLSNMSAMHEEYLKAKTLLSPHDIDRVRFGWMISICILLSSWLGIQKRKSNRPLSIFLLINAVWLIIFLHIVALRTGLLSLYVMALIAASSILLRQWQHNRKEVVGTSNGKPAFFAIIFLFIVVALPIVAYQAFPTFRNRVKYFLYEMPYFKNAAYLPGSNDAVRIISFRAGWELMEQNPVTGVGFGDVSTSVNQWYEKKYPQMLITDRIAPGSQWIIYGAGCGWPGFLAFLLIMIIPFTIKARMGLPWYLLQSSVLINLVFDDLLEIQYGVFLYTFMILWCWKWREN